MIDIKCGPVTFNHNTICNLHREEWLRGGASGQEFMLVNSIYWKQEKWIIHVLLLQQETGGNHQTGFSLENIMKQTLMQTQAIQLQMDFPFFKFISPCSS